MRKEILWPIALGVGRRALPVLLGALVGLLADAGLLDGHTVELLRHALSG